MNFTDAVFGFAIVTLLLVCGMYGSLDARLHNVEIFDTTITQKVNELPRVKEDRCAEKKLDSYQQHLLDTENEKTEGGN